MSDDPKVWTMPESSVYHTTRDCTALNRSNRYWSARQVPLSKATSREPYKGRRRPCRLCTPSS